MRNSRGVAIIAAEIKISSISTFLDKNLVRMQYSKKILYEGQVFSRSSSIKLSISNELYMLHSTVSDLNLQIKTQ